jgi:hypothetical protein
MEPNLRTAIDASEHRRGEVTDCLQTAHGVAVVGGLPNPSGWAQVRPGEVVRVLDGVAATSEFVVVDGVGQLDDIGPATRGRYATARAVLLEADIVVAVADASPVGLMRVLSWLADAAPLAGGAHGVVVVNRAPSSRYRRGEIFDELRSSSPMVEVVFAPTDPRVTTAAWQGDLVGRGPFVRAIDGLAALVEGLPARAADVFEAAS